jgi:transcriptional regulator with XRE-family HTH domain
MLYNKYNTLGIPSSTKGKTLVDPKRCDMASKFSALLKSIRLKRGLTLREFCLKNGFDPGNYSRLERGLFPPPESHELLERYALALSVKPGSDQWIELFDLAAAERGRIPEDIMSDQSVVEKLPVFFRTMRGKPLSSEQLDELVGKIRRS